MKINTIGDTHLGKKFEVGVPLHRRGEREAMQLQQFYSELLAGGDLNIQMGDIFDKMVVPYGVIAAVVHGYREARKANPNTIYALLRGNHDASRDVERTSAFDILTEILRPMGVLVAKDEPISIQLHQPMNMLSMNSVPHSRHVLIPWHPVYTAMDMLERHVPTIAGADVVYGHWDVVMGDENRIPAAALKSLGVTKAVTGHDHSKRTLVIDELDVEVTGSMQPYSHAEDPDGHLYVTVTLAEALTTDLSDKCVRILLKGDEVLDQPIECLQLQLVRGEKDQIDLGDVDFEAFDLRRLFEQARVEVGVDEDLGAVALQKLEEERAASGG